MMEIAAPVRVLIHVAGLGTGGMETFVMNVYRNIDRTKVQFDFILSYDWGVHAYDEEIKALGGQIFYLPGGVRQFTAFYKFLKEHPEYKVVHTHRGTFGAFYLAIARMAGIKHRIVHAHTSGANSRLKSIMVRILRPFLCWVSTKRFSCGTAAGKWMYGNASFEIFNNAIDIDSFRHFEKRAIIRENLGVAHNDLLIGHVGRFCREKNHTFIIDIFNVICSEISTAKLLLIGDGPLLPMIKKKVDQLGLTDNVIFLQNRRDVNELLTAIDFVVFPSYFEGFSFAMLEMEAASLRILASKNIPPEINLTGEVYFKDINDTAEDWARQVLLLTQYNRELIGIDKLIDGGFDIKSNVRVLEQYYLDCHAF